MVRDSIQNVNELKARKNDLNDKEKEIIKMKKFVEAEVVELNVNETAHNWTGIYQDGGYIGDGEISGHLQWTNPDNQQPTKPTKPTKPDVPEDFNS